MLYDTAQLTKLVHPEDLEDVLKTLKEQGIIKYYKVLDEVTTIQMVQGSDIRFFLTQETKPVPNPYPYVKNKRNKP